MAEFDNRNSFVLFRNKRKENEKHADFNGTFTDEDGNEFYMDAWTKNPKNPDGEKFLKGTVKRKKAKTDAPQTRAPALNDDMPF